VPASVRPHVAIALYARPGPTAPRIDTSGFAVARWRSIRAPNRLNSIRSRILVFAILATLVPALGLGILSFSRYQALINDDIAHELRILAGNAGSELVQWQRERGNEVRALAASYALIDGLAAVARTPPGAKGNPAAPLELYLRSVQKKLDTLLALTVTDVSGRVIASTAPAPAPVVLPASWSDASATADMVVESPQRDTARGTATLNMIVPIRSPRNEWQGALFATLDLATAAPRLSRIVKSPLADAILLAPDGTPLLAVRGDAGTLTPLDAGALQRLRGQPGTLVTVRGHRGREVLALAEQAPALPVVVVAEADRQGVYDAWVDAVKRYLALVAGLTLVVGVVAYALSRSIVTPLDRLIGAADRVAGGDLTVELSGARADEIGHLMRVFNTMTERLRRGQGEVLAASASLQEQNELLAKLSVTDSLTGLANRSRMESILADQFARYRRNHRPFAVLMLDIDHFKAINDAHGHAAGDEALAALGNVLAQSVRNIDFVARYGGEEFVMVLVDTGLELAIEVAERIRALVETLRIGSGAAGLP